MCGLNKISKKVTSMTLFCVVVGSLFHCQSQGSNYSLLVQSLEKEIKTKALENFKLNSVQVTGQIVFMTCEQEGNQTSYLPYSSSSGLIQLDTSAFDSSQVQNPHFQKGTQRFSEFGVALSKLTTLVELVSLDATLNCGSSLVLSLKDGSLLVRSKVNMDNHLGFQYKRKVIHSDWAVYQIK